MYIPGDNRLDDISVIYGFMKANNFAIVISNHDGLPVATHLPLTLSRQNEEIIIRGHFAKANVQWQTLEEQDALVVFSGPHAYISPTHYDRHESVPTWNYVVAHAYGRVELVHAEDQPDRLDAMLEEMIMAYEPPYLSHWGTLSTRYRDGMKRGIVGFELLVTRLQGKAKLSQNKNHMEQQRIADTLLSSNDPQIADVGYVMQNGLPSKWI